MKIAIEIPNIEIAKLVEKALKDSAWEYEEKREYCKNQYEIVQNKESFSPLRKRSMLEYYSRRGAENYVLSEKLWEIGQSIIEQAKKEVNQILQQQGKEGKNDRIEG